MSVLVVVDSEMTAKQYDQSVTELGPKLPAGCSAQYAGPRAEGGWRLAMVWDSPELARRYLQGTLGPVLARLDMTTLPTPTFSQIHHQTLTADLAPPAPGRFARTQSQ